MPNYTTNYNLVKPLGAEAYNIAVPNDNMDTLDATLKRIDNNAPQYVVATGTNTLVVTLDPAPASLYAGLSFRFYNPSNSTALVTINANNQGAKALRKNGGTQVGADGLKQGIYTVAYDGTSFILQGEDGGENGLGIKNVIRGTVNVSSANNVVTTITIPSVNADKTVIDCWSRASTSSSDVGHANVVANVTNSTTVEFTRAVSVNTLSTVVEYQIIEFEDYINVFKSYGIMVNTVSDLDIALPSVDLEKSQLFFNFYSATVGANYLITPKIINQNLARLSRSQNTQCTYNLSIIWK